MKNETTLTTPRSTGLRPGVFLSAAAPVGLRGRAAVTPVRGGRGQNMGRRSSTALPMNLSASLRFRSALALAAFAALLLVPPSARAQSSALGNTLSFNGVNQYVSVPNFGAIMPTNEVTVEFWAYANRFKAQAAFTTQPDPSTPYNRFLAHISYANSNTYWDFGNIAANGELAAPSPTNSIGNWVHYAFVASSNGNFMRIYVNGVLSASKSGMSPFVRGSYNLQIGGGFLGGGDSYLDGRLDEFRVWSTARSQAQIQASLGTPLTGSEANLVAYYRFDETSGTVATNSATATGSAYNGTLVNGPARVPMDPVGPTTPLGGALAIELFPVGYVSVPNFGAIMPTNEVTVEFWAKTTNSSLGNLAFRLEPDLGSNAFSAILNQADKNQWLFGKTNTPYTFTSEFKNPTTAQSNWTHYAFVASQAGNFMRVYVNGEISGNMAVMTPFVRGDYELRFGVVGASCDEFRVWKTARSSAEIMANFARPLNGSESNLLVYYRLDELGGNIVSNSATATGPAYNGVLSRVNVMRVASGLVLVTNRADSGTGSLRQTIADSPSGTFITFSSNLTGATILLTNGQLVLNKNVTIDGFPVGGITVDGNANGRVFLVDANVNPAVLNNVVLNSLTIRNGLLTNENDILGAGINNSGNLVLNRCTVSGNSALFYTNFPFAVSGGGGGIASLLGNLTLNQCTIVGNSASRGFLTISGGGLLFGGLTNKSSLSVVESSFIGNSSLWNGGGIGLFGTNLNIKFIRSTFTGNSAAAGGGIFNLMNDGEITRFEDCTIVGNITTDTWASTNSGGGIFNSTAALLINCIVAGNINLKVGPDDLRSVDDSAVFRDGANIIQVSTDGAGVSNIGPAAITSAPLLAPLGNYGGPTLTMPPLPGSPALDAAVGSTATADQRGFTRPVDGDSNGSAIADIGAVESTVVTVTTAVDELNPVGTPGTGVSLREALRDAPVGAIISFANTLSGQTINLTNELRVDKNVMISANHLANGLKLNGGANGFRLFAVAGGAGLGLKSLTLTGGGGPGFSGNGGAISNAGPVTLDSCTLSGNSAGQFGGALYGAGAMALIQCTITGNSSGQGGGAICNSGPLSLTHCTASGNVTAGTGGAILNYGPLTLERSIVSGNRTTGGGGLDIYNSSSVSMVGTNLVQGLVGMAPAGPAALTSAPLLAPLGNYGGPTPTMPPLPGSPAIDGAGDSALVTDQRGFARPLDGNGDSTATADIGAVESRILNVTTTADSVAGSLRERVATAAPGSIIGFSSGLGTSLTLGSELVLNKNLILAAGSSSNGRVLNGGAGTNRLLTVSPGVAATLVGFALTNGHGGSAISNGSGGAILNQGTLSLVRCTLAGNAATIGGAILNDPTGSLLLQDSTLALNTASAYGGAINNHGGQVAIYRCTISSNSAGLPGLTNTGGGLANSGSAQTRTTVAGSIVSANDGGDVQELTLNPNTFSSGGHNLIGYGNRANDFVATGDLIGYTDPKLFRLGDNGGGIGTMHPRSGSPVLDAGGTFDPGGTDQRGLARFANGALDIGSVEAVFGPVISAFAVLKVTDLGPPATDNVEITYDLVDPEVSPLSVTLEFSRDGGNSWAPAASASGALGSVATGSAKRILWNAKGDLGEIFTTQARLRIKASEPNMVVGRLATSTTNTTQNLTLDTRPRVVTVKGRIVDTQGYPVRDAQVVINVGGTTYNTYPTDAKGNYEVANVPRVGGLLTVQKVTYSPQERVIGTIAGIREHVMEDIQLTRYPFEVSSLTRDIGGTYLAGNFRFNEQLEMNVNWGQRTPHHVDVLLDGTLIKRIPADSAVRRITTDLDTASLSSSVVPYAKKKLKVVAVATDGELSVPATDDLEFVGVGWLPPTNVKVEQLGGYGVEPRYSIAASWPPAWRNPFPKLVLVGQPTLDFSVNLGLVYAPRSGNWQVWLGDPGAAGVRSDWRPSVFDSDTAGFEGSFSLMGLTIGIEETAFATGYASKAGFGLNSALFRSRLTWDNQIGELCISDYLAPGSKAVVKKISDACDKIGYDFNSLQCIRFNLKLSGTMDANTVANNGGLQFQNGQFIAGGELSASYKPDLGGWINLYAKVSGGVYFTFTVPQFDLCNTRFVATAEAGGYLDFGFLGKLGDSGKWVILDATIGSACPGFLASPGAGLAFENSDHNYLMLPVVHTEILSGMPAIPPGEVFVANDPQGAGKAPAAASPSAAIGQADQMLVTNVLTNSAQALAAYGSELMLVYTRLATSNSLELVWSRYNGTSWSVPATIPGAVSAAIFDPTVSYDGAGNAVVAWQQVGAVPPADTSVTAITASLEVKSAHFTNNVCSPSEFLTSNSLYDGTPKLCGPLPDGDLLLVWQQNQPGTNFSLGGQLLSRRWDSATRTWGAPVTLDNSYAGTSDFSCASGAGKLILAWSVDADGSSTNVTDTELYYRIWTNGSWLAPVRHTTNAVTDRTVRVAVNTNGTVFMAWLQGNQLMFSTNFGTPSVVQSNVNLLGMSELQLTVGPAGNALLLWSEPYETGSDGRYAVYDATAGIWGQPSPLWKDRDAERKVRLVWDSAGRLAATYFKERLVFTTQQITMLDTNGNSVPVLLSNVTEIASTDLAFTTKQLLPNLTIKSNDFTVANENFLPGNTVAMTARLSNTGDLAVQNPGLKFSFIPDDGSPEIIISNQVYAGWLPAQTSQVFTAIWIIPTNISRGSIVATNDPAGVITESDESAADNMKSLKRGGTDLVVAFKGKSVYPNGTARVITSVFNAGAPASPNATLELRRGDGSLVATAPVPPVPPGDAYDVVLDLTNYQAIAYDRYTLRVDPATVNDADGSNNVSGFNVFLPVIAIADTSMGQDTTNVVAISVAGPSVILSGTSSDTNLLSNASLLFGGSGTNRTLTLTPAPGQFGETTITVTSTDGETTNSATFVLTVVHTTSVVLNTNDAGPGSLRAAILAAPAITNHTVTFAPNLAGASIVLISGQLTIEKNLTIDASALPTGVSINGNSNGAVVVVMPSNSVVLKSLTITNGSQRGIGNGGNLSLFNCTVSGNQSSFDGGGIYSSAATLVMTGCTVSGNTGSYGGGLWTGLGGSASFTNCTFSGNVARYGGSGFAIYVASVEATACTVTSNTVLTNVSAATNAGAIYNDTGALRLSNSIVAGNTAPYSPDLVLLGGSFSQAGINLTNGNPLLAPLGDYGGPTWTMPPLPGSPAVDGATNGSTIATDQRGFSRPLGIATDLGAAEGIYNTAGPGRLIGVTRLGDGSTTFTFTNYTDTSFTVFATTNIALPSDLWSELGPAVETPPGSGRYQFTDPAAVDVPQRFYRVRSP